jgi:hypothetical protein
MSSSEVSRGRLMRIRHLHPACPGLQFDIRGHSGRSYRRMGTERPWSLPADGSWNLRTLIPVSARPWDSYLGSRSELWAELRLPDPNLPGAQEAAPVCGRSSDGGGPVGPDRGRSTKDPGTVRASLARRHPRPRCSDEPPTRLGHLGSARSAGPVRGPTWQVSSGQHRTALTSAEGVPSRLVQR